MKTRRAHILKPNMRTEMPQRVIFFDTETIEKPEGDETELVFKLGSAVYWRRDRISEKGKEYEDWLEFTDIPTFWEWVFNKCSVKSKIYLVAHNISFDMRVLKGFDEMRKRNMALEKFIYAGTMNIWEFRGDRTICFIDNMNYFKSSLAHLGDSIGVPKMVMPDVSDDINLMIYCKNDVKVMLEAWRIYIRFLQENDLGNFAKTIAGQALNAYRHRFMRHMVYIHTWEEAIKLERESYHGGRTECFEVGKLPDNQSYYMLDVNSMYPSVMSSEHYPTKLEGYLNNITIPHLKELLDKNVCITAKVTLDTYDPVYPLKRKGKLIFPIGKFETVLTTRELIYAIDNKHIKSIEQVIMYKSGNLFNSYVSFFYNKRREYKKTNNEAFSYICKLFLNSLYGKFGQRNETYETIGEADVEDSGVMEYYDENNNLVKERIINGKVERLAGYKEGYDSFVAIASHVTADARMKLWHYFKIAGRSNVFYCDTDSLLVNEEGYKNCQKYIGKELGQLDIKGMSNNVEIYGAKDYVFDKEVTMKGIRKDAEHLGGTKYKQVRFEGMAGAIRNNHLNKMVISNITKELKRDYTKGVKLTGGKIKPFKLDEKIEIKQGKLFV